MGARERESVYSFSVQVSYTFPVCFFLSGQCVASTNVFFGVAAFLEKRVCVVKLAR